MASIRLPESLETRLNTLARLTKRSKSFYIIEAIEQYLEDMEDGAIAMQRALRPNRKFYTSEEVLTEIKKRKRKH